MSLELDPSLFWVSTIREIALQMRGADLRLRREYNGRMELAFWASNWSQMKKPPKLDQMLVEIEAKPKVKKGWRALKVALQIALSPKTGS